jgi:hypothetical protein
VNGAVDAVLDAVVDVVRIHSVGDSFDPPEEPIIVAE